MSHYFGQNMKLLALLPLLVSALPNAKPGKAHIESLGSRARIQAYIAFPIKLTLPTHIHDNLQNARALLQKLNEINPGLEDSQKARILALSHTVEEYMNTTSMIKTLRAKRGLLDLGGKLLKGVFGTATIEDIEALKSAYKNTTNNIISTQKAMAIRSEVLKEAVTRLNKVMGEELRKTSTILKGLATNLEISGQIALIAESLQLIQSILNRYIILIQQLQAGKADAVIRADTITTLLNENQKLINTYLTGIS